MSTVQRLHHVEFLCRHALNRAFSFARAYGFSTLGSSVNAVAVRSGSTVFVFRERGDGDYPVDTVRTLALAVDNDQRAFDVACAAGAVAVSPPSVVRDENGSLSVATAQTPFGNVRLTFIRNIDFYGQFMPGFSPEKFSEDIEPEHTRYCDHITFACPLGSLDKHVAWYERALGFRRFSVNRAESEEYGFVVDSEPGNVGLRLKAMDYWRCSELGVMQDGAGGTGREVKLVFAEPLQGVGECLQFGCEKWAKLVQQYH